MKRTLSLLLAALMMLGLLAGCSNDATGTVRIAGIKGPTSMGLSYLFTQSDKGETKNEYEYTLVSAADEVTGSLVNGDLDLAALPTNVAATLYNRTNGGIRLIAVNTLGVLYIVTKNAEVTSIEDLAGQTIYAAGQGSTPEYALNYILSENGIEAEVVYMTEQAEVATRLASEESAIALLPQPFVAATMAQNPDVQIALDITEEWQKVAGEDAPLTMGCIAARTEWVEENPEILATFLDEYKESVDYVTGNTEEAAQLIGELEIIAAPVAQAALPYCNIVFLEGDAMRASAEKTLEVLYAANPESVGGAMPGDDFYYAR